MKCNRKAFTLIELLVVIAIIAILAAILFPVFAQAKAAAKKTVDVTRFNQIGKATHMYLADNEGRYMMSNTGGGNCWGCGGDERGSDANRFDQVPGEVLMPYCKNFEIFTCPNDPLSTEARIQDHCKDMGWNCKDMTTHMRTYAAMVRSNMGYNYAFFSPWRNLNGKAASGTISESQIGGPSSTLMFSNSIWDRDPKSGVIKGGGNWVIETPCWMDANGVLLQPMYQYGPDGDKTLFSYSGGWYPPKNPPGSNGWLVYGGVWPFHNQKDLSNISAGLKDGVVIIEMADSSTKAVPLNRLLDGCSAYGNGSRKGKVTDTSKFLWDLD